MPAAAQSAPFPADRPSLTLERRLDAPPALVYAAWTQPERLARWFGPDGGPVKMAKLDVRVGGRFHVRFQTEDGEEHNVGGEYREVVPNERLVFTWAWFSTPERESLVEVTIRPDGDGALLRLHHSRFFDEAAATGHRRGWTGSLDKLAALFG